VAEHGTTDLFLPPQQITITMSNQTQSIVQALIPRGGVDAFWPTVVLSYATSCRGPGIDAEGAGPGMYFAAAMVVALAAAGFPCFSGLCIPGGVDWKTFLPRLQLKRLKRAKAKVLIVLLSKALYKSVPCLEEIHTALENGVAIFPVRIELDLPGEQGQWAKLQNSENIEDNMKVATVQAGLNKLNFVPARGTLLEQLPTELPKILDRVREMHGTCIAPAPAVAVTTEVVDAGPVPVEHLCEQAELDAEPEPPEAEREPQQQHQQQQVIDAEPEAEREPQQQH
jgi:hypothetical protein